MAATAVLATLAGAAVGASAAVGRREALTRAAAYEFEVGRPDRAAALAAEALAADAAPASGAAASDAALRFLRAEALLAAGDVERSLAERDVLLRSAPGTPWARAALDLCALEQGACSGPALDAVSAVTRGPLGLAAAVAVGERMARGGNARATEAWGRPLESGDAAAFWLLVLAHAHLASRDTVAARAALERAVERAAAAGNGELVSEAALRRAALAYHEGDAEGALRFIQRVTDEKGRTLSCPAAIVTGYAYYRLDRMAEAAQAFNYAQACARDKGERGRLLALEARSRALSGEARLAAAVAGDAAQDLEAAARGEVGTERLEDATDVLGTPLELDVDRSRVARGFFFARAAAEGWLEASAEANAFRGFPFRVGRELDGEVTPPPPARRVSDDADRARAAGLEAERARERADDRTNFLAQLAAPVNAITDSLTERRLAPEETRRELDRARGVFAEVGRAGGRLVAARSAADSTRAQAGADRARAIAVLGAPAADRREDRAHAIARADLEREADFREAFADSAIARAARRQPGLRDTLPHELARAAEAAHAAYQARMVTVLERARSVGARLAADAPLAAAGVAAEAARAKAARAADAESVLARDRVAAASERTARRTALLRERAEADYEVALFERSAWAAIALDEQDSTEADLRPALAAGDDFLRRFPNSRYVPAAEFNRADLEARVAVARARERGGAPDFGPAIARYEQLLAAHPDFRRADAALFNIAALERARGSEAGADRRLAEVIARAPDSELAAEAHLALGDRAFETKRYDEAEGHFRAVAARGGSYAPMARYKEGYSALLRRDAAAATNAFGALLATTDLDSSTAGDALVQLARALRLAGGAPALAAYLDAHPAAPYGEDLVTTVAQQEKEDGALDRAARAWRLGIERYPRRPGTLGFGKETLAAWDARGRADERFDTRLDLGRAFAPGKTSAAEGPEASAFGAQCLLDAAFLMHERGRTKDDRVALERAVEVYRERARLYPAADQVALAATSEGEALFDLGRYGEAARAQERSVAGLPLTIAAGSPADTLRREAAFGAALARERVAAAATYRTPAERDSLERAIDRFEQAAPGDVRLPPLRLSLALGAKDAGDSTRARTLFERMAGRDSSEASRRSQAELGRIALGERRWLDAEKHYAGAGAAYLGAGDRSEETRLLELAASARFKQAEAIEAAGDTAGAAKDFRALADRYPGFPRADVALYRAGLDDLAAGAPQRAEEHLATLRERYPNSKLVDDALLRRAEAQLAARDTSGAAQTYASAPLLPGADGRTRDARTQALLVAGHEEAARLWRTSGSYTDAEAEYRKLAREAPDPQARTRALADLATLVYGQGRRVEAWQATAPWRAGRLPEGFAPDAGADRSARFVAGRLLADSCLALPVAHPIKPALDRKLALLGPALDHLKAAATTTESPYWGESGYVAGLLLDDLGTRVAALPPPSKMSAADSAGYTGALGTQANSFYARAEDLWIATLEGLADLAPAAPAGDTTQALRRPIDGWPGRIWERLEPRLVAHYQWRLSAADLPPEDTSVGAARTGDGGTLIAGLDDAVGTPVAPVPGAMNDSLDAGAVEDLRNRMRWIAQYVADEQVDEAGRWADAALKSFPNRAEIWNDTGVARQLHGDWAGADAAWARALQLDPKNPSALYNRAVFERFYRLDRAAARRAFERFLTLGLDFDEALADRMAEDRK